MRQSLKLTAPQINSAAFINHRSEMKMIIFLQIFLVWETQSKVIFYLSQVEWWKFTCTFIYQLLSPSLRKVTHRTFYRFTKIIINSRCFENFFTGRVCESLASYLCLTISSVFPTFRVGYYAGKPTESAVYCLYIITFEQNILCFNFLWVTYAINDRFLTNLVHL